MGLPKPGLESELTTVLFKLQCQQARHGSLSTRHAWSTTVHSIPSTRRLQAAHIKKSRQKSGRAEQTPYLGQLLTESMHASLIVHTPEFDDTTFTWTDIIIKK